MINWTSLYSKFFPITNRKAATLGILSGILIGTSYIPFQPWAVFFCYVPLFIHFQNTESPRVNFWAGWWSQFTLTLIGFHWIAYTAHEFAQIPWILAVLILLVFAALMHIYIAVGIWLAAWIRRRFNLGNVGSLLVLLICLIFGERYWPCIFPWHLGYTFLWAKWPIYQWADVIGFQGLSALIFFGNALIYLIWKNRKETKRVIGIAAVFVFVFCSLNYTGYLHGQNLPANDKQLRFVTIQANIGNFERVYAEKGRGYQAEIASRHIEQTKEAITKFSPVDAIVWPESAFPDFLDPEFSGRPRQMLVRTFINEVKVPLLTGAFSKDLKIQDSERSVFNAFFSLNANGNLSSPVYHKTQLLAFGEYLPFSETFPWLSKLLPFISSFGRGTGPQTVILEAKENLIRIGPQICYEGLDPNFSRELAKKGAQIIVNVTNDSWFGKTFEPNEHGYMTLARAIENRIPLIRSTNTGITTTILANGTVLDKSPLHEVWSGAYDVPFMTNPVPTIYTRFGAWDQWFYFLILVIVIIQGVFRGRSNER